LIFLSKYLKLSKVSYSSKKPIIGILGGICSGKSSVAAEFAKLGCKVIDADEIAHELLGKKALRDKITATFGKAVLDSAGKIDRLKLADIAFSDGGKLALLNSIIHPAVLARAEKLIEQYSRNTRVKAIVLDMPLLVEVGWDKRCDKLVFVACDRQLRIDRAKKMGLFGENQFRMRENFQISLDNKARLSDNIVDNNSGFSLLARQVAKTFSYIVK